MVSDVQEMTDEEFGLFRELVYKEAGIHLTEKKKTLLTNRIRKRLVALGIRSFSEYYRYLRTAPDRDRELVEMIDAVTTNVTEFFRNPKQFDAMREKVLPLVEERNRLKRTVKVLSAGCSSGEEPYSIAILLEEHFAAQPGAWDWHIDAFDISSAILRKAEEGIYPADKLGGVNPERLRRHFQPVGENLWQVRDALRRHVSFRKVNLVSDPLPGRYDMIFCRNVVIYFDRPTKDAVYDKFHAALVPDGFLFVGYSEGILNDERFRYFSPGIYVRQERKGG